MVELFRRAPTQLVGRAWCVCPTIPPDRNPIADGGNRRRLELYPLQRSRAQNPCPTYLAGFRPKEKVRREAGPIPRRRRTLQCFDGQAQCVPPTGPPDPDYS